MPPLPLSASLGRVAANAVDRKSAQLGLLLSHWEEIIGRRFAAVSYPVRLARGRTSAGCILHVAVPGAWTTEFRHEVPVLTARINAFFGHGAVSDIRLVARAMQPRPPASKARPVAPAELGTIRQAVEGIADERLRAALLRLGVSLHETG